MKALKFTLIVAVVFATLTSCTKQDLNEEDVLVDNTPSIHFTGGGASD